MKNTKKGKKPTQDFKDFKVFKNRLKPSGPFSGKKSQTKKIQQNDRNLHKSETWKNDQ